MVITERIIAAEIKVTAMAYLRICPAVQVDCVFYIQRAPVRVLTFTSSVV